MAHRKCITASSAMILQNAFWRTGGAEAECLKQTQNQCFRLLDTESMFFLLPCALRTEGWSWERLTSSKSEKMSPEDWIWWTCWLQAGWPWCRAARASLQWTQWGHVSWIIFCIRFILYYDNLLDFKDFNFVRLKMCFQTQHVLTPSGSTCFVSSVFQTMSYAGSGSMCHPRSTTHWFGNQTMFSSELWSTAPVPAMWMPRNCVNLLPWKSLLVSTTVCACFNLPHCAFACFSFCLTLKVWRLRKYASEGVVAPAKPLWHLRHALSLEKGQCQRVV